MKPVIGITRDGEGSSGCHHLREQPLVQLRCENGGEVRLQRLVAVPGRPAAEPALQHRQRALGKRGRQGADCRGRRAGRRRPPARAGGRRGDEREVGRDDDGQLASARAEAPPRRPRSARGSSRPSSSPGRAAASASAALADHDPSSNASASMRQARSASVSPSSRASAFGEPKRGSRRRRAGRPSASTRHGSVYTFIRPSRTKPQRVMPRSARELDREASTARRRRPAAGTGDGGLLDELEGERPLTQRIASPSGSPPSTERPADDLVHRVVAAHVLAEAEQSPSRRRGRSHGARRWRRRWAAPRRALGSSRARRPKPKLALDAGASTATASSAPLPQTPQRTRCRGSAADARGRSPARRPRPCSPRGRPAARGDRAAESLREAEPERKLLVMAGRAHRDRDRLAVNADLIAPPTPALRAAARPAWARPPIRRRQAGGVPPRFPIRLLAYASVASPGRSVAPAPGPAGRLPARRLGRHCRTASVVSPAARAYPTSSTYPVPRSGAPRAVPSTRTAPSQ